MGLPYKQKYTGGMGVGGVDISRKMKATQPGPVRCHGSGLGPALGPATCPGVPR